MSQIGKLGACLVICFLVDQRKEFKRFAFLRSQQICFVVSYHHSFDISFQSLLGISIFQSYKHCTCLALKVYLHLPNWFSISQSLMSVIWWSFPQNRLFLLANQIVLILILKQVLLSWPCLLHGRPREQCHAISVLKKRVLWDLISRSDPDLDVPCQIV